jgi:hypothetical protein
LNENSCFTTSLKPSPITGVANATNPITQPARRTSGEDRRSARPRQTRTTHLPPTAAATRKTGRTNQAECGIASRCTTVHGLSVANWPVAADWSDHVAADVATLEAGGVEVEAKVFLGDDFVLWAYCKDAGGPRIELVSRMIEPVMSEWFITGKMPQADQVDLPIDLPT